MDEILRYFFDFRLLAPYWPDILRGFLVTVKMSVLTIIIGIPLGLFLAVVRLLGWRPLNALIILYIDLFRAIPQLVLIILAYFAVPYAGLLLSPFTATVVALALVLSAFAEEIFWAGLTSVPKGQWEAGRSTGLGFGTTLTHVILPQVVRIAIPPLTNRAIGISKGTTLGSVVAASELLNVTSSIQATVANPTALTVGAVLFLALFLPLVRLTRWLEKAYATAR